MIAPNTRANSRQIHPTNGPLSEVVEDASPVRNLAMMRTWHTLSLKCNLKKADNSVGQAAVSRRSSSVGRLFSPLSSTLGSWKQSFSVSFANLVGAQVGQKAEDVLWTFLEAPSTSLGAWFWSVWMLALIIASCGAFVIETEPGMCCGRYDHIWSPLETTCIAFFTFEFVARLLACPLHYGLSGKAAEDMHTLAAEVENHTAKRTEGRWVSVALHARGRFLASPLNVIDVVAILPFYIELALSSGAGSLAFVRVVRLIRVFRLLKFGKYSEGLQLLGNSVAKSFRGIMMLGFFLAIAVVIFSSMLYFAERGEWCDTLNNFCAGSATQGPGWYMTYDPYAEYTFESGCLDPESPQCRVLSPMPDIFTAGYFAMSSMTTTGYGDVVPHTPLGKLAACIVMLCGLLLLALPITVISGNFAQEYAAQEYFKIVAEEEEEAKQRASEQLKRSSVGSLFSLDRAGSNRTADRDLHRLSPRYSPIVARTDAASPSAHLYDAVPAPLQLPPAIHRREDDQNPEPSSPPHGNPASVSDEVPEPLDVGRRGGAEAMWGDDCLPLERGRAGGREGGLMQLRPLPLPAPRQKAVFTPAKRPEAKVSRIRQLQSLPARTEPRRRKRSKGSRRDQQAGEGGGAQAGAKPTARRKLTPMRRKEESGRGGRERERGGGCGGEEGVAAARREALVADSDGPQLPVAVHNGWESEEAGEGGRRRGEVLTVIGGHFGFVANAGVVLAKQKMLQKGRHARNRVRARKGEGAYSAGPEGDEEGERESAQGAQARERERVSNEQSVDKVRLLLLQHKKELERGILRLLARSSREIVDMVLSEQEKLLTHPP